MEAEGGACICKTTMESHNDSEKSCYLCLISSSRKTKTRTKPNKTKKAIIKVDSNLGLVDKYYCPLLCTAHNPVQLFFSCAGRHTHCIVLSPEICTQRLFSIKKTVLIPSYSITLFFSSILHQNFIKKFND